MGDDRISLGDRSIAGIGWVSGAGLTSQLLQFVTSIILARLLTPEDFGLVGMIFVFTGFVMIFSDLGFGAALVQIKNVEERHLSSVLWINIAAGSGLSLLLVLSAPLIAAFYGEQRLHGLIMVVAPTFFFGSLKVVQVAVLTRKMQFRSLALAEFGSLLVGASVGVTLAVKGYGAWSIVWQSLAMTITSVLALWVLCRWRPQMGFDVSWYGCCMEVITTWGEIFASSPISISPIPNRMDCGPI